MFEYNPNRVDSLVNGQIEFVTVLDQIFRQMEGNFRLVDVQRSTLSAEQADRRFQNCFGRAKIASRFHVLVEPRPLHKIEPRLGAMFADLVPIPDFNDFLSIEAQCHLQRTSSANVFVVNITSKKSGFAEISI